MDRGNCDDNSIAVRSGLEVRLIPMTPAVERAASIAEIQPVGSRSAELAFGAALVCIVTLGFFLLFFNRFAGVRTINGSGLLGIAVLEGRLPYRDMFFAAPPMYALKNAVFVELFGRDVIMPRIAALFERTLLVLVLYFWLARLFRPAHAVLGSVLAIVASACDVTDPISSYNHDTIFWAVVCGYCASVALGRSPQRRLLQVLLSGVAAGMCFSTKQTIGLGVSAAVPVILGLATFRELKVPQSHA